LPKIADIQYYGEDCHQAQDAYCEEIGNLRIEVDPSHFKDEKVGVRMVIGITQLGTHLPVPIGTQAVSPSIPDAQYKPG